MINNRKTTDLLHGELEWEVPGSEELRNLLRRSYVGRTLQSDTERPGKIRNQRCLYQQKLYFT